MKIDTSEEVVTVVASDEESERKERGKQQT